MFRVRLVVTLILVLFGCSPALAQMPFLTDDPGVADAGMLHLEISNELDSLQSMQFPDLRQDTANFKANFGLPFGLELDIDAPYIIIDRASGVASSHGVGDTNLGVKWNIRDVAPNSRKPGFAVSFYTEFPTGDSRQELGSGLTDYWLNFIAQLPITDSTRFNLNLGVLFAGNTSTGVVGIETTRGQVYVGGLSMLHDFSSRLSVGAEVFGGISDTTGLDRTQLQAMLGAQYTIHDGVTLCLGLTGGIYTASPKFGAVIGIAVDLPHFFHLPGQKSSHSAGLPARESF
jgi:hypothetical protein